MSLRRAVVYSRHGCHLCERLIEELLPLVRGCWEIEVIDIDSRENFARRYGERIPVLEVDGRLVCQHTLDRTAVEEILDGDSALPGASGKA